MHNFFSLEALLVAVAVAQNSASASQPVSNSSRSTTSSTKSSTTILAGSSAEIDVASSGSRMLTSNGTTTTTTKGTNTTTPNPWSAAESCNAASVSWINQYGPNVTTSTQTLFVVHGLTYIPPAGATPTTTLCDGYPRAHGSPQYYLANMTQTLSDTITIPLTPEPNSAMPTCTINSSECSYLASSSISFTDAQSASLIAGLDVTLSTPSLACNYTGPTTVSNPTTITPACSASVFSQGLAKAASCLIQGSHVQVAYWPVTESGNYLCGNGTTITPNATLSAPRTAFAYGTTIASPGVLLSIDTLYATDPCGRRVGTGLSNIVLAQHTSQISSQCAPYYHDGGNVGTQVNFADYNSPVPYSAYACLPQCNGGSSAFGTTDLCSTIFDGDFKPILALPTDIVSLQPEWANCIFGDVYDGMNTIWDPPQALVAANTEAGVTVPVAKTTSASPASAPAQPTQQPTTTPSAAADTDPSASPSAVSSRQGSSSSDQGIGGAIASGLGMTKSAAAASSDPTPGGAGGSDGSSGGGDVSRGSEGSSNHAGNGGDGSSSPSSTGSVSSSNSGPPGSPATGGGSSSGGGSDGGEGSGGGGVSGSNSPISGTNTAGASPGDSPGGNEPGNNAGGGTGTSNSGSGNGAPEANPPTIATVGSDTLRVDSVNTANIVAAGTTLTPGQGTVINNTPISVAAGSVVIGSNTVAIPTAQRAANAGSGAAVGALLTLGDSTITAAAADASGAISIAGQTLSAGETATIDGHTVVAGPSGVAVDGSNVALSSIGDSLAASGAILTAGSSTITAVAGSNGAIIVGGDTLTLGQATVVNGHTISDSSGSVVVDGSSTMQFSQIAASETVISAGSDVLTVTELPSGVVVVDGHTMSRGGPGFTIDGHFVSDGPSGAVVVSETPSAGSGTTGNAQPSESKKGDASSGRLHLQMSAATVVVGLLHLVFIL